MSWEKVKLQVIIEKPIAGEWGDGEGDVNILRSTNFTNDGKLDLSEVVKRNISLKKVEQKKLEFGDTIIEKSGGSPSQPVGRVVYFDQKSDSFLCNNFTSVIRAKEKVDKRYLFWFLFNNHLCKNTLSYQNKTTGIINLQLERYINDLQIPLPPLPIQKRIAEILDAADALKRKDQLLLKKYDELAQAIFIDMFGDPVKNEMGWEVKKFIEFSEFENGDRSSNYPNQDDLRTTGIPFYGTNDMKGFEFKDSELRFISVDKFKSLGRGKLRKNDLVITLRGSIGNCVIFNSSKFETGFINAQMMIIRPNHRMILPRFMQFVFTSFTYQNDLKLKIGGSAVPQITGSQMKDFELIIPPMELQIKFVEQILLIDAIYSKSKFIYSETLFNSLIQKAFNGELVK